jgi:hypothetical protein
LNPDNSFVGPLTIGRHVRVVERIALKDADTLQIVVRLSAPELLKGPLEHPALYHRDRSHVFREETLCVKNDRSIDPVTGRQRFDLTPPPDLPPPPAR